MVTEHSLRLALLYLWDVFLSCKINYMHVNFFLIRTNWLWKLSYGLWKFAKMLIKGIYCFLNNGLYLIWNKRNQNWNYFIASKIRSTLCKQLYHSFLMKEEVFIQISNMESQSKQSKIPRMVNWPQVMFWHSHVKLTVKNVTAVTDIMKHDPFHMLIFHVFHKWQLIAK